MNVRLATVLVLAMVSVASQAQVAFDDGQRYAWSLPDGVRKCFSSKSPVRFDVNTKLNPFYLRGDFDGDGRTDYAILVAERGTNKTGIAICRSGSSSIEVLGPGTSLRVGTRKDGYDLKDFDWMDAWEVASKQPLESHSELNKFEAPPMVGEALHVIKSESADAFVYWSGKRWIWYQLGD